MPSVISGVLIGASADRTASFSLAFTIARSMNRPSMRLGFSIASVRPRPGSRSSVSAPVPKCTSRSSSAVVRFSLSLTSQASEVAIVDAPTPPRVPMTAIALCGRSRLASIGLGALSIAWAWPSDSRSASGCKGLSR